MTFSENYKLMMIPVYRITSRGLVGIGCQWLPMATNNLLIDYQYTIIPLTKFLTKSWLVQIGKNKYFILQWQNIGNRNHALITTNGKSMVESNIWKLWPAKIFKCIGKRLALIGNQYVTNRYQYRITIVAYVIILWLIL